jgi:hypothetical protein
VNLWGRRRARADRLTLGLSGVALATAGTVVVGELVRLARQRRNAAELPETVRDSAERAIAVTGAAAQDTVTVAIEGYEATPRHETVLFNILAGFVGGFALIRTSTYSIRRGWNPFGSVHVGGRHVHHFVPGMLLAFVAGGAALLTQNDRLEETLAFPFGAGIGLTFDEAALLLEFEDVYWTREGLLSVQLSLGLAALLGATILGLRMLRRGERQSLERGLIPNPEVTPPRRVA